ncbi:MAG: hypothetical protein A2096_14170 [Spirochaetes bacterium GWF1_41_5]|nr:MAG: hypothetical protein A2096_14170 [Spirochaetes bacterium GWF1_41_5]
MNKIRIFLDTSVIGGCYDLEFAKYSNALFEKFFNNELIPAISTTVVDELTDAPPEVKNKIQSLKNLIIINITDDIIELAKLYLKRAIITEKYFDDALHIATATINKIDVLVSWNFRHIVNLQKIHLFNSVNIAENYSALEIRTPMELLNDN